MVTGGKRQREPLKAFPAAIAGGRSNTGPAFVLALCPCAFPVKAAGANDLPGRFQDMGTALRSGSGMVLEEVGGRAKTLSWCIVLCEGYWPAQVKPLPGPQEGRLRGM